MVTPQKDMYMFKCQASGKLTKSREKAHKSVTKIREVTYRRGDQVIGTGWEIVEEILVCSEVQVERSVCGYTPEVVGHVDRFVPFVKREDRV